MATKRELEEQVAKLQAEVAASKRERKVATPDNVREVARNAAEAFEMFDREVLSKTAKTDAQRRKALRLASAVSLAFGSGRSVYSILRAATTDPDVSESLFGFRVPSASLAVNLATYGAKDAETRDRIEQAANGRPGPAREAAEAWLSANPA